MSTPAKRCASFEEVCRGGDGAFCIEGDFMYLNLPGDTVPSKLRIAGEGSPQWELTGASDRPTLKPSINAVGQWHGWLTNGVLTSV